MLLRELTEPLEGKTNLGTFWKESRAQVSLSKRKTQRQGSCNNESVFRSPRY